MNKVRKGNRRQLACRRKMEAEGWQVEVARRSSYLGEKIDFFTLWDMICWKDGFWKLIQVKSNYTPPSVRQKLKEFKVDGEVVKKELWVYIDFDRKSPYIEQIGNIV